MHKSAIVVELITTGADRGFLSLKEMEESNGTNKDYAQ